MIQNTHKLFCLTFSDKFDCDKLPESMSGPGYAKGCPGAVWTIDGTPSEPYCEGLITTKGATYPWWKICCYWDRSKIPKCQPKGNLYKFV